MRKYKKMLGYILTFGQMILYCMIHWRLMYLTSVLMTPRYWYRYSRGSMTREQGLQLGKIYDNDFQTTL